MNQEICPGCKEYYLLRDPKIINKMYVILKHCLGCGWEDWIAVKKIDLLA